jgi:hypothetical protein
MFGNLFKKEESESKDKPVSKSKSLFDNYISTKKEISYLEDKYDDFIVRSLEVEFEQYKQCVDSYFPSTSNDRTHWMISKIQHDEFTLNKKDNNNNIKIRVNYSFYQDQWKLKYAHVSVDWNSTKLDENKINDIIFQYFIYWQLKQVEKERLTAKQSFQKMVDIIGKDVKRDSLIDQILS